MACTTQSTTNQTITKKAEPNLEDLVVSDGPYVDITETGILVKWICNNQTHNLSLSNAQLPYQFSECGLSANIGKTQFEQSPVEYSGDFPIAVVSDVHGQHDLFMTLLKNNGVIDNNNHWTFGNGRFVITGDIFDRGPKVMETLWFLYHLEQEAAETGGQVLYILGNHEEMVLNGDLRYLNPKYFKVAELFETSYPELFSKNSLLGQWLRSKPVVIKVNDSIFLHGGVHPELAENKVSLQTINYEFKNAMNKRNNKEELSKEELYWLKPHGPIWYRGYFRNLTEGYEKQVDKLLDFYIINQIGVGHTSVEKIESHFNGKIFAVDASMKNGLYGELLFIEDSGIYAGTLNGKRIKLKSR